MLKEILCTPKCRISPTQLNYGVSGGRVGGKAREWGIQPIEKGTSNLPDSRKIITIGQLKKLIKKLDKKNTTKETESMGAMSTNYQKPGVAGYKNLTIVAKNTTSSNSTSKMDPHLKAVKQTTKRNQSANKQLTMKKEDYGMRERNEDEGKGSQPTSLVNAVRKYKLANNTESRLIHKTVYQTGFPASKGVRAAARISGTGYTVLYDTKMDLTSVSARNALTTGSGFNCKLAHIPVLPSHGLRGYLSSLINQGWTPGLTTQITNPTVRKTVLSSIMRMKRQWMIHNTSAYLPIKFKIYLLRMKGGLGSADTAFSPFVNSTLTAGEIAALQTSNTAGNIGPNPAGKVPFQFQFGAIDVGDSANGGIAQALNQSFSMKSKGFFESDIFKESYDVVETFQKTLEPGDFWNFNHIHNFGGGIDIDKFASDNTTPNARATQQDPYMDTVMFEVHGVLCEGVYSPDGTALDTYIGVSPTYFTYESKVSAYYVKDVDISVTTPNLVQGTDISSFRVHRREFVYDPIQTQGQNITKREFHVLPANIANSTTLSAGQLRVPMLSQSVVVQDTPQAGPNAG